MKSNDGIECFLHNANNVYSFHPFQAQYLLHLFYDHGEKSGNTHSHFTINFSRTYTKPTKTMYLTCFFHFEILLKSTYGFRVQVFSILVLITSAEGRKAVSIPVHLWLSYSRQQKIIWALHITRVKKLIPNAVLWNKCLWSHDL